jgi:hypothetical protein
LLVEFAISTLASSSHHISDITTYLSIAPKFQILLGSQTAFLFRFFFRRRLLDSLSDVAQYLPGAQHAVCVEAVVAEFRISFGRLFERYGEGEVPVG